MAFPIEGKVQPYRDISSHPKTGTQERNQVLGDCPHTPNLLTVFTPFSENRATVIIKINANQPGGEFTFLNRQ